MGASLVAYWPGISEEQLEGQPGLYNGATGWAAWAIRWDRDQRLLTTMQQLGVGAVCSFTTNSLPNEKVNWVAPAAMEAAALRLRQLVLARDASVDSVVQSYAAPGRSDAAQELAQDLADIAGLAAFAAAEGVRQMTLRIDP
jgi:hypothetical protein